MEALLKQLSANDTVLRLGLQLVSFIQLAQQEGWANGTCRGWTEEQMVLELTLGLVRKETFIWINPHSGLIEGFGHGYLKKGDIPTFRVKNWLVKPLPWRKKICCELIFRFHSIYPNVRFAEGNRHGKDKIFDIQKVVRMAKRNKKQYESRGLFQR